jgi:hypothetical protein
LYKVQKYKSGRLKLKEICTGAPSITGAENLGDKNSPKWHYKFKIESKTFGEVNLLLSPKEFSSNYTFKSTILNKIPVLFTGSKLDFEMFIFQEMSRFDFSEYY